MGGKSTYCRTVALLTIMSMIGSFVPAKKATISIVDAIRCRIGAGDRQVSGISTFMAEMLDISGILEGSTPNSLVIIDELGRGKYKLILITNL
jgi:DNA mismatch repair protein MSH2